MAKDCKEAAKALVGCLAETPCVKKTDDYRGCLKDPETAELCKQFHNNFVECKRSGLDMRTRITGQKHY